MYPFPTAPMKAILREQQSHRAVLGARPVRQLLHEPVLGVPTVTRRSVGS